MSVPVDTVKIRMDYYDGSDGPRIMLFGPMSVDIGALQQCFRTLAKECGVVRLEEQEFIVPFGDIQLLARCCGSVDEKDKAAHEREGLLRCSESVPQFEWVQSAEEWSYLADLIDSLVRGGPGHHYLTHYPDQDAIIVVSKGEYSDEVLSR